MLRLDLKIKHKGKAITSADSFNILGWMLSGPGDFDAFKDFNAFNTNSSVILMSVSGEANFLSSICGMNDRSSPHE